MFTYTNLLESLEKGVNFSTARYGDGEWMALLQDYRRNSNTDGHIYYPDMGERLKSILESNPEYYLGLQPLATEHPRLKKNKEFKRLVKINTWELDNEMFPNANKRGTIWGFLKILENRRTIVVGNYNLKKLGFDLIEVPGCNCWTRYKFIKHEISKRAKNGNVILYCASMMSNVLIDDFKDHDVTQIDVGSAFDPLVGVMSRKYHYEL